MVQNIHSTNNQQTQAKQLTPEEEIALVEKELLRAQEHAPESQRAVYQEKLDYIANLKQGIVHSPASQQVANSQAKAGSLREESKLEQKAKPVGWQDELKPGDVFTFYQEGYVKYNERHRHNLLDMAKS